MFVGGGVVFVHGGRHGGCALSSMGGVVVICGARRSWMGCGDPWALDICEWGLSMGGQHLWVVVVVYGGRLCGVLSVGSHGHPWGHRVLVGDGGAVVIIVVVVVGGVLKETGDVTCHRKLLINKHGDVDASDHVMYPSTCSYVM